MTYRSVLFRLTLAITATLAVVDPVGATSIDLLLLEELVLSADMVAFVECETAGGLTARFKVTESFKGPAAGAIVTLQWPANYWGDQFPVVLCEERYFVTAYKAAPTNLVSTSFGGPVPFWWRRVPADFELPLAQGMRLLPVEDEKGDLPKMRQLLQKLLAMNPAEQEAALLRALIDANLLGQKGEKANVLEQRFEGLKTTEELIAALIKLARENPEDWTHPTSRVVRKGGMARALTVLEQLPKDQIPWTTDNYMSILRDIRARIQARNAKAETSAEKPMAQDDVPPLAEKLAAWRESLSNLDSEAWEEAFAGLTRHDPASVVETLLKLEIPNGERRRDRDLTYGLASYFAAECGKSREEVFGLLLKARDPWTRVAAAVYLCFENEEKGVAALKELTALPGNPGGWAALTLARRGHKDAVPRALQLFPKKWTEEEEHDCFSGTRQNLQNHLLVLLSNAAHAGKAPQYSVPEGTLLTSVSLQAWWQEHQDHVVLQDPWLELLANQKID